MAVIQIPAAVRRLVARMALPELIVYVIAAVLLFHNAWSGPRTTLIGSPGDSVLFVWFLKWTPFALAHGHNPLLSDYMNYPDGVNLMWNTSMPLAGITLWPVTAVLGPVFAYNLLVTASLALSAWAASMMIRRYVPSRGAAFAGGALYGFSPYMIAHAGGHPDLVLAVMPPLLLLTLDDIIVRQRRPWYVKGTILGLLLVAQFFLAEEILAIEALAAGVGLVVLMILFHDQVTKERAAYAMRATVCALAVVIPCTIGPLLLQFRGPQRVHGVINAPDVYVSDLLNFVIPVRNVQWWTPSWTLDISDRFTGNGAEQTAYLGLPLAVLLGFVIWRRRQQPLVRFLAITGCILAVLSLGPSLHVAGRVSGELPGAAFSHLPVLDNLLPGRLMISVFLLASILFALFMQPVIELVRHRERIACVQLVLVGLVVMTLLPTPGLGATPAETPSFFTSLADARLGRHAVALVVPYADSGENDVAMLWQSEADMAFRMPEGYFQGPARSTLGIPGPMPSAISTVLDQAESGPPVVLTPTLRQRLRADLRRWYVSAVVVGPPATSDGVTALFTDLLGFTPRIDGGVEWWPVSAST